MIKLDDKWYIDADGYQYVLFRKGKEYKEKGFARLDATYHMTLEQAVERYARIREAALIANDDVTLPEAMRAIRALAKEINALRLAVQEAGEEGGVA